MPQTKAANTGLDSQNDQQLFKWLIRPFERFKDIFECVYLQEIRIKSQHSLIQLL